MTATTFPNSKPTMSMKKSKHSILFIATEYEKGMRPYACTIIHSLWNDSSHAIVVIKDEKYKHDFTDLEQSRIHFVHYPTCKCKKLLFRFFPQKLKREIKRVTTSFCFDTIYSLTEELVLCNSFNALQKRIPVLYTIHDAISHDTKISLLQRIKRQVLFNGPQKQLINKATYKVTNSHSQFDYIRRCQPKSNVYYAPFPTLVNDDIKNGGKLVEELAGITDYILFFGSIHLYKGVDLLYKCYLQHPELHNRPLVLAGSGQYYFNRSDNEKNVTIINRYISDKEMADLFNKASLVVYPYISATQSGVISIASFFKKPIVLSDVDYFKEVASGFPGITFFRKGDIDSMANAISTAITEGKSSELIYEKVYSSNAMTESITNIINDIVDNNK